jgi:hypothetical protein
MVHRRAGCRAKFTNNFRPFSAAPPHGGFERLVDQDRMAYRDGVSRAANRLSRFNYPRPEL